jgi:hypothetical protein
MREAMAESERNRPSQVGLAQSGEFQRLAAAVADVQRDIKDVPSKEDVKNSVKGVLGTRGTRDMEMP